MSELTTAWTSLRAEPPKTGGWLARRIWKHASAPIFAALRQPDRTPALLVDASADSISVAVEYPSTRGFTVFPETIEPGPHGRVRLCLVLADTRSIELFQLLAEDVAACVARAGNDRQAMDAFLGRLRIWQAFFRWHADGLSPEEQRGLFGEIIIVQTLLDAGIDARRLMAAWQGPSGAARDFCFPAAHIEVKAGDSRDGFRVNSAEQLDDGVPQAIVVAFVEMLADPEGRSLHELVAGTRASIEGGDPASAAAFDERLLQSGFILSRPEQASDGRWRFRRKRFYRVHGDFPRIRRADLRTGITDVRYGVDLSKCVPYEIPEATVIALVKGPE